MNTLKTQKKVEKLNDLFSEYIEKYMSLSDELRIGFLNLMIRRFFEVLSHFNLVAQEVLDDIRFIINDYLENIQNKRFEIDEDFMFEG